MSPKGKPLTDEQYAAIAWADPRESTMALSRRLGVEDETVRRNRERIARAGGWWCELAVLTCPACGKPLLVGATKHGGHRWSHPACRHEKITDRGREWKRQRARQRHHERTLAVMQATYQRDLPQSGPYAFRHHVPWTVEEDGRLLETMNRPARELATELGRSPESIYMRRSRLRRDMP
jgi:hypothetical protein